MALAIGFLLYNFNLASYVRLARDGV